MCRVEPGWCEEDQLVATKRVISIIHSQSVHVNVLGTSSSESSDTELLSAPAFAFCFPLLRCVLKEGGKAAKADEDLRQEALQVVAEHCKLRASDDEDDDEDEEEQHNEVKVLIHGRCVSIMVIALDCGLSGPTPRSWVQALAGALHLEFLALA